MFQNDQMMLVSCVLGQSVTAVDRDLLQTVFKDGVVLK